MPDGCAACQKVRCARCASDMLGAQQVTILKGVFPKQYGFPGPTFAMARKLWPMAMGWWVYGVSGVIALKYLNVPMFSSFRRFTTIIVMYGEYRLYGTREFRCISAPYRALCIRRSSWVFLCSSTLCVECKCTAMQKAHDRHELSQTQTHHNTHTGPPADQRNAVILMSAGAALAGESQSLPLCP